MKINHLVSIVAAGVLLAPAAAFAAPFNGFDINKGEDAYSSVDQSRVFCYNRSSGRFLHWGYCGVRHHPRVYCQNRYTGRFLHWGSCY